MFVNLQEHYKARDSMLKKGVQDTVTWKVKIAMWTNRWSLGHLRLIHRGPWFCYKYPSSSS